MVKLLFLEESKWNDLSWNQEMIKNDLSRNVLSAIIFQAGIRSFIWRWTRRFAKECSVWLRGNQATATRERPTNYFRFRKKKTCAKNALFPDGEGNSDRRGTVTIRHVWLNLINEHRNQFVSESQLVLILHYCTFTYICMAVDVKSQRFQVKFSCLHALLHLRWIAAIDEWNALQASFIESFPWRCLLFGFKNSYTF